MIGAGVYDDIATEVRAKTESKAVVVIVLGGNLGSGFSIQGPPELMAVIPDLLQSAAMGIRSDLEQIEARILDGKLP